MGRGDNIIPFQGSPAPTAAPVLTREAILVEIVMDLVGAIARHADARVLRSPERIEAATAAMCEKAVAAQAYVRGGAIPGGAAR